jgi:hypothetical protein
MNLVSRSICKLLCLALLTPIVAGAAEPTPYMRVTDADGTIQLEIALKKLVPKDGDGPTIWLSGVIHIAEAKYYKSIQKHLDDQKLVLFEGVGGPPFVERGPANDATRIKRTHSGIRFVATMLQHYHAKSKKLPASLKVLQEWVAAVHPRYLMFLARASLDGWDQPLLYQPIGDEYELRSLGNDGQPGGKGAAKDLSFDDQKPLRKDEMKPIVPGLQADMAEMLGLQFQMNSLNYNRKHFRHSDVKSDNVRHNLKGNPDPPGPADTQINTLMSMMDGSGVTYKIIMFAAKLLTRSKKTRSYLKLMLIETTGSIKGDLAKSKALPPAMQKMMRELIVERNKIVMDDLKTAMAEKSAPASISVFYGAAHMHDFEKRIVKELGYTVEAERWFAAMSVDPKQSGLTRTDILLIRQMVKTQMKALGQ